MRVKLIVSHSERGVEPRTYVLEQDTIVIGRAGTCDLPLEDPDRVVSKQHAEIRTEGDALRVFDLGSKNHTFIDGARVGTAGAPVPDGSTLHLGPFEVRVEVDRDRLVADDLDRTVFGAAFENPFTDAAEAVASALGDLRRAFHGLDYGHRADALRDALHGALGADAAALTALVVPDTEAPAAPPPTPDLAPGSLDDLFGPPIDPFDALLEADAPGAGDAPAGAPGTAGGPDDLHRALAASVVQVISIPGKFRHEFLGHTVIHSAETAFLFDADVDALLDHLTPDDPATRAARLAMLDEATEAVLQHHQSLLEGYRAAVHDGAAVLVNGLDPDRAGDQAQGGGLLQGGRERALLDLVRERCAMMRSEDFAAAERRVYRPAFARAYLDSMARFQSAPHAP